MISESKNVRFNIFQIKVQKKFWRSKNNTWHLITLDPNTNNSIDILVGELIGGASFGASISTKSV